MTSVNDPTLTPAAATGGETADFRRARAAKSRRIAWALAGVVALLYALAFLIQR